MGKRIFDCVLVMVLDYIKVIKKILIVVNDSCGFYIFCVVMIYIWEGLMMLVDGVLVVMIENVGKMVGMLVGLFLLGDEVVFDLVWKIVLVICKDFGVKYVEGLFDNILEEMVVKKEWFGCKNVKGFYDYKGKDKVLWFGILEVVGQFKLVDSFNIEEFK